MAINEHAIRMQARSLFESAKLAIKTHKLGEFTNIADRLVNLSKALKVAQNNAQFFGGKQASLAGPQYAHRVHQSTQSKLNTLQSLDDFIASEWRKIIDLLAYEAKKSPWDGKNRVELFDVLAGEVDNYATLIKQMTAQVEKTLINTPTQTQTLVIRRDISTVKNQPTGSPVMSLLLLLSIILRLASFINTKK